MGLACAAFLIAASGVAVDTPWWALAGMALAWLAALLTAVSWFTRRPRSVAVLAAGVLLGWFAVLVAGARYLGWE